LLEESVVGLIDIADALAMARELHQPYIPAIKERREHPGLRRYIGAAIAPRCIPSDQLRVPHASLPLRQELRLPHPVIHPDAREAAMAVPLPLSLLPVRRL
jgi:hypothetical protein